MKRAIQWSGWLILLLVMFAAVIVPGCLSGCASNPPNPPAQVSPDWKAIQERLTAADYILRTYTHELPEGGLKTDLNAFRSDVVTPVLGLVSTLALGGETSVDPAVAVWQALDAAGALIPRLDPEDRQKAGAILAGLRAGLILFGRLPAPAEVES